MDRRHFYIVNILDYHNAMSIHWLNQDKLHCHHAHLPLHLTFAESLLVALELGGFLCDLRWRRPKVELLSGNTRAQEVSQTRLAQVMGTFHLCALPVPAKHAEV